MTAEYTYTYDSKRRRLSGPAATVQVSVSSYRSRVACGFLRTLTGTGIYPFCGLDQAVLLLEEILDRDAGQTGYLRDGQEPVQQRSREAPCRFLIRIYGRQNQSLQGELRTGNGASCFRSGMELMRLMHQHLEKEKITKREDRVGYGQREW